MTDAASDLNYAIVRVARRHRRLAGELLGELGLHPGQEAVLNLLWARDERSQVELAAELGVEPPTVHRTLSSLERAGFLRRTPSPTDGRVVLVGLTDQGRAVREDVTHAWAELSRRTTAALSADQARTLHELLVVVGRSLDPQAAATLPGGNLPPRAS